MIKRTPEQQQALDVISKEIGDFRFFAIANILLSTNLSLTVKDGELGIKNDYGFVPFSWLIPEDKEERGEVLEKISRFFD